MLAILVSNFSYANEQKALNCPSLEKVIETYQTAIVNWNENEFRKLFFNYSIPWIGVEPNKMTGTLPSNDGLEYGSVAGFAKWVATTGKRIEEKMTNIKINSDGYVGNIFYDYEFFIGDKLFSKGSANWSLLKTSQCWKITSKTYSKTAK